MRGSLIHQPELLMDGTRARLSLESTKHFARSAMAPDIASITKSRLNPMSCVIVARIHE
jgi:hypothetical protein